MNMERCTNHRIRLSSKTTWPLLAADGRTFAERKAGIEVPEAVRRQRLRRRK